MRKKCIIVAILFVLGIGTYAGVTGGISITEQEQTENTDIETDNILQKENIAKTSSVLKTDEVQETEPDKSNFQIMEWSDKIYLPAEYYQENILENILGYTLCRTGSSNIWYDRDLDYLLDDTAVGNGVFVSEHMHETEPFIGLLLKEVLTRRGEIEENRLQYFTETTVQMLEDTDWSLLDEEWEVMEHSYRTNYTLNHVFGEAGYDFFYAFGPDGKKITKEETYYVTIELSINSRGIIYDIWMEIDKVPTKNLRPEIEMYPSGGLFRREQYSERIITDGCVDEDKILLDYSVYFKRFEPDYQQENCGLLVSGDAAVSAAGIKELLFRSMNGDEGAVPGYAEDLKQIPWEDLGEGWIPERMYDCYYIDEVKQGHVSFEYYFYPDYVAMGVEEANAAVVSCTVGITEGDIYGCGLRVFPITQAEYAAARERRGSEKRLLVDRGRVLSGGTDVEIPLPNEPLVYMPLSEYRIKEEAEEHYVRETAGELWGFQDAADAASYLGDKFLRDFETREIHNGEIDEMCLKEQWQELDVIENHMLDEGWEPDRRYDCYCILENECAGCMHLRYYFYSRETDDTKQRSGKAAAVDVYLSEEGIEDIQVSII
ncbi:MAG: hypothetical protein K2P59_01955 [Acetatifactor sp.]|nr:hypothetical protein [Acetatifactor sp.]